MIGGIPETQEMLDFCAEHGIVADIEMIHADEINVAYQEKFMSITYDFKGQVALVTGAASGKVRLPTKRCRSRIGTSHRP